MKRTLIPALCVAACLAAAGREAGATVVRAAGLDESIRASEAILVARVAGTRAFESEDGRILTGVRLRVEESLKGAFRSGDSVEIAASGGELNGRRMVTIGEASYRAGERVLVQLERIDGRWHTLGLSLGKWSLTRDERGTDHVTRDLSQLALAGPERVTAGPLPLDDFRRRVREAAGGR